MTLDMPDDFALDQPLSPFLLAALELLDPESDTYALDVISMAEATLEDPKQVLRAQERQARDKAMADMKADGLDYDERMDKLQEITYPKPLEDMLEAAFDQYRHDVPWANDYWLSPKSVVRDMVETASDFTGYITRYNIARSEGTLLRYLSDAYRTLARTVPPEKRDEQLEDIISWLRVLVRSIDSSLVDEWENAGDSADQSEAAASLAGAGQEERGGRGPTRPYRADQKRHVPPCAAYGPRPAGQARRARQGLGLRRARMGRCARRLLRRARVRGIAPKRARPNCSCWMTSTRTTSIRGRCVRLSMIPMATTTGPSKASWTSTPPKTPAK